MADGCQNSFINGKLAKDVYMSQPEGFVDEIFSNRACKLENPFMNQNKYLAVGVFASMRKSTNLVSLGVKMSHVCMSRLVGV